MGRMLSGMDIHGAKRTPVGAWSLTPSLAQRKGSKRSEACVLRFFKIHDGIAKYHLSREENLFNLTLKWDGKSVSIRTISQSTFWSLLEGGESSARAARGNLSSDKSTDPGCRKFQSPPMQEMNRGPFLK